MSLEEIYQEVLLSHNEHPNNFEILPDATHQAHGHNPLCGDEISIFVVINDGKIVLDDSVKNLKYHYQTVLAYDNIY